MVFQQSNTPGIMREGHTLNYSGTQNWLKKTLWTFMPVGTNYQRPIFFHP